MRRRKSLSNLVELDPEIERTFRIRRRRQRQLREEQVNMGDENRTLKDYAAPKTGGLTSAIARPNIDANNFELKPSLLSMVQQNQFGGSPTEDPNLHISMFLEYCDTLKLNGVSPDAIKLRLFPFSLRDKARAWLHSLTAGSITTWDQLSTAFLAKFFPPSKTAELRSQISTFAQKEGESLYEAWERFKELLRLCPHHGFETWFLVHAFYNGMTYNTKISVDAAAGGALMNKGVNEAYNLIEGMAQNHNQWSSDRATHKKTPGKYDVDAISLLSAKVDALSQKFDQVHVNSVGTSNVPCEICGDLGHLVADCQLMNVSSIEQVNFANNFNQKNDPFSNTYNPGWKNHPNFSYRNNSNPLPANNTRPPGFQPRSFNPPPQKSNLESLLENFVVTQTKLNEEFKQQNQVTSEAIRQLTSKVDSLATHNTMLDSQIAQIAKQVNSTTRSQGTLPGQPEHNPKAYVNAIFLRSSELVENPRDMREEAGQKVIDKSKGDKIESEKEEEGEKVEEEPKYVAPPTYKPPLPYPNRLAQAKIEKQFGKFFEMLKKLSINIPFLEAISQMPSYGKFLKEILSKKRKIEEYETVCLTQDCSDAIQNKLPPKLKDPGSFSIPCMIGDMNFDKALCDLGASVSLMPLSIYKKLKLGKLMPTSISIQLADRSIKYPVGVLEDVPIQVGKFFIPVDFIILDMEEDVRIPIILGRPFMATAGVLIDVKCCKLSLNIGDEKVEFDFSNAMMKPSFENSCCRIDSFNEFLTEDHRNYLEDSLTGGLWIFDEETLQRQMTGSSDEEPIDHPKAKVKKKKTLKRKKKIRARLTKILLEWRPKVISDMTRSQLITKSSQGGVKSTLDSDPS